MVAYRVPDGDIGEGRIVIHRIVGGDEDGFTLEGANNSAPDPWLPRDGDVVGEAWVAVPTLGRVLAFLHQPALLAALAAAVVVTLIVAGNPQRAPAVATDEDFPERGPPFPSPRGNCPRIGCSRSALSLFGDLPIGVATRAEGAVGSGVRKRSR